MSKIAKSTVSWSLAQAKSTKTHLCWHISIWIYGFFFFYSVVYLQLNFMCPDEKFFIHSCKWMPWKYTQNIKNRFPIVNKLAADLQWDSNAGHYNLNVQSIIGHFCLALQIYFLWKHISNSAQVRVAPQRRFTSTWVHIHIISSLSMTSKATLGSLSVN